MPIRKADITDLDVINKLLEQLGGYPNTISFLFRKLPTIINNPESNIYVYEQDGNVIGLAVAQMIFELGVEKDTMLITYLVVSDQFRSLGIGRKLEQYFCDLAISKNCGRIQLHCSSRRTRAHKFYQSLDYTESPTYFTKLL